MITFYNNSYIFYLTDNRVDIVGSNLHVNVIMVRDHCVAVYAVTRLLADPSNTQNKYCYIIAHRPPPSNNIMLQQQDQDRRNIVH